MEFFFKLGVCLGFVEGKCKKYGDHGQLGRRGLRGKTARFDRSLWRCTRRCSSQREECYRRRWQLSRRTVRARKVDFARNMPALRVSCFASKCSWRESM